MILSPGANVHWTIETDTVEWDQALANVYGIGLESAPKTAAQFLELVHPNDRAQVEMSIADALKHRKELIHEFRMVSPDKSVRWIYDRSRVVRHKDGSPQCLIGACMDITDRKEAEEQKTVLIDELKHRVKNTLAVVQSLVRMTLRGAKDFAQFEENLGGRLAAVGAAHALLSGESWRHTPICARCLLRKRARMPRRAPSSLPGRSSP